MSIDYYLQSKRVYKNISYHLKEIVELYNEFIELTKDEENLYNYNKEADITNLEKLKTTYQDKLKELSFFKDYVNNKITDLCNHEFTEDSIDITPDTSQNITYCNKCEYTKEYA